MVLNFVQYSPNSRNKKEKKKKKKNKERKNVGGGAWREGES